MKRIFKPDQEIERNRELTEALKEKDPFLYNLVKSAKFSSIEKLNNLLEKLLYSLRDIEESFAMLSTNPKAYNMALVKYGKILDGLTHYLGKAIEQNQTNEQ